MLWLCVVTSFAEVVIDHDFSAVADDNYDEDDDVGTDIDDDSNDDDDDLLFAGLMDM